MSSMLVAFFIVVYVTMGFIVTISPFLLIVFLITKFIFG